MIDHCERGDEGSMLCWSLLVVYHLRYIEVRGLLVLECITRLNIGLNVLWLHCQAKAVTHPGHSRRCPVADWGDLPLHAACTNPQCVIFIRLVCHPVYSGKFILT